MRNRSPKPRRRSRATAASTAGSSSTATIAGRRSRFRASSEALMRLRLSHTGKLGPGGLRLCDRDLGRQVDVLDRPQQLGALVDRALERLAARDQAHAAGALVDDRGPDGLGAVALPGGRAAAVDEARAAHVAVDDLVAGEVDRMVGRELRVDALVDLAVARLLRPDRLVAAVVLRELLLDDVRLDRDAEVVGLAGQVGGGVVVGAVDLEAGAAQVAPQHGEHAELVGLLEGLADLLDLAAALRRAEVDRRADADRAHVPRALDAREHRLVVLVRIAQQLVVVELEDERQLVRVRAADGAEDAERRGDRVAAALDREADEVLGIEVDRVGREARARRVLDALVDRQDRDVAGPREAAVVEQPLQVAQRRGGAVGAEPEAVDRVRARKVELVGGDRLARVLQEALGFVAEELLDLVRREVCRGHGRAFRNGFVLASTDATRRPPASERWWPGRVGGPLERAAAASGGNPRAPT